MCVSVRDAVFQLGFFFLIWFVSAFSSFLAFAEKQTYVNEYSETTVAVEILVCFSKLNLGLYLKIKMSSKLFAS